MNLIYDIENALRQRWKSQKDPVSLTIAINQQTHDRHITPHAINSASLNIPLQLGIVNFVIDNDVADNAFAILPEKKP